MLTDIVLTFLLLNGAVFTLVGSIGLLKLREPMSRLHAPTKASTLGVGSLLLASMINAFAKGDGSLHELLIMAFVFVTAPITGNFIAKVHLHRGRERDLRPAKANESDWATYAVKNDVDDLEA